MEYTIRQAAARSGLSEHTLRYYEKEGLLRPVGRTPAGVRFYTDDDINEIAAVTCLKNTGMPIREIRRFVALRSLGDATLQERRRMVLAHKRSVEEKIASLRHDLEKIDSKLAYYDAACAAGTEEGLQKPLYSEEAPLAAVL